MKGKGKVTAVSGQIVEVEFIDTPPMIHDVLVLESDPGVRMEVHSSASENLFYALLLTPSNILSRGSVVLNTNDTIKIPAGLEIMGRVINLFGEAQDGKGEIKANKLISIFGRETPFDEVIVPSVILETGIKAIDFFSPILKGGKVGLFGGAGVGKTILLTEIIHNVVVL